MGVIAAVSGASTDTGKGLNQLEVIIDIINNKSKYQKAIGELTDLHIKTQEAQKELNRSRKDHADSVSEVTVSRQILADETKRLNTLEDDIERRERALADNKKAYQEQVKTFRAEMASSTSDIAARMDGCKKSEAIITQRESDILKREAHLDGREAAATALMNKAKEIEVSAAKFEKAQKALNS